MGAFLLRVMAVVVKSDADDVGDRDECDTFGYGRIDAFCVRTMFLCGF